jgi:hypothetical protein
LGRFLVVAATYVPTRSGVVVSLERYFDGVVPTTR